MWVELNGLSCGLMLVAFCLEFDVGCYSGGFDFRWFCLLWLGLFFCCL